MLETPPPQEKKEKAALSAGTVVTIGGAAALVLLIVQNTQDAKVEFLFWDFTWPTWLLIIVSAAIGAALWFGAGVVRRHRRRKERRADRRD